MRIKKLQKSMRSVLFSCGLFLMLAASMLTAQTRPAAQNASKTRRPSSVLPHPSDPARLISPDDGLAILGAALEGRYKTEKHSDCSHLVHAIYEKAGFPYKYQPSADLYAGIDEFHRVSHAQPGDLIVWIGHAGVVVSPTQHTFYSALRSGFGMQPYDSVYWRRRGRPHFFRYVKATSKTVLAAKRTPALRATGLRDSSEVDAETPESDTPDAVTESATKESATRGANVPGTKTENAERIGSEEDAATTSPAVPIPAPPPRTIVIYTSRLKADQVSNALREQFQAFADTLQTRDLLALEPSVISFDRLDVQKLQTKGNGGHAQLHLAGAVELGEASARSKERDQVESLQLQRAKGGWEVVLPSKAVYVPRETVVRILAHHLAALTDANHPPTKDSEKVELARWLNVLLDSR
jgi:NlpC/P60 family